MNIRKWTARVGAAGTAAMIGLVGTGAVMSPASADAPTKVGWWNSASGGGQAAPAPGVPAGGIRVAVASGQQVAFGAVDVALAKDGSGTLSLPVAQMTGSNADMLNSVMACPTKDDSWKPGDDQPMSAAPAVVCSPHAFIGNLSSDGKTMTFNVDGSADVTDGILSVAVVAVHSTTIPGAGTDAGTDLTPPFAVDFDKPTFTSDDAGSSSSSSSDSSTLPGPTTTGAGTGTGAAGGAAVPAAAAPATTQVDVPAATATDSGQTPVVAGQAQPAAPGSGIGTTVPAAATKPLTGPSENRRDLLLVMLMLLLFGILYTQNAGTRPPRALVGPRARSGGDPTDAALPVPYPTGAPRGLGRFSKPRSDPARPLI